MKVVLSSLKLEVIFKSNVKIDRSQLCCNAERL